MRLRFSANEEGRLLLRFIAARGERGIDIQMLHFCQQYRNLGLGSSFLNDAHTTRWLADWRDRGALDRDLGSTRRLLNAIRDWVGLLFREQVLDDDAFYYLDIGRFLRGKALPKGFIAFGEVGLAGEVRPAPRGQERLKEAAKLGFSVAVVPKANAPKKNDKAFEGLAIHAVERIEEAMSRVRELS